MLAWPAVVAVVAVAGTVYIATHNPHHSGGTYVCPLFALTGLYCPGCGGTRAVYDLAHGDIASAIAMNPLFTLAVPILGVLWTRWVMRLRGIVLREWPFPTWAGIVLPTVIVAFFILRNLGPLAPLLAP
jgi:hypothetical protein